MSCSANPTIAAPTADVVEQLVVEYEGGDDGEDADDDGVLEDGRERVRHAVVAKRIDDANDEQVDEPGGQRELLERAHLAVELAGDDLRSNEQDDVEDEVRAQRARPTAGACA